jgi:hypothetical protein
LWSRFAKGVEVVTSWLDRAMYFPPRQDRPARTRRLPATVHRLEVVFGLDGMLAHPQYQPIEGFGRAQAIR